MIAADGTDTVVTRAFDIALGYPWPASMPERVIGNGFTDAWDGREHELAADHGALAHVRTAIADGDYRLAPVNAGLGVGDVVAVEPAAAVIARLCAEAWDALRR